MTKWEQLCELVTNESVFGKQKRRYGQEKSFEDHFSEYLFSIFNWRIDEIQRQNSLPIGNGQEIIPDIFLKKEGDKPIIFELKNYTISADVIGFNEIKSQIKQASTNFGIFTNGITLHLFYRSQYDEEPEEIFCIPFRIKDNQNAIELCNLLERDNYSTNKMTKFCERIKKFTKINYDNDPRFFIISSQMNDELDAKISRMITKYIEWLDENPKEYEAAMSFRKERDWVRKNIFDTDKLRGLTDDEYSTLIHDIHKHALAINGAGMMQLYGEDKNTSTVISGKGLIGDRKRFIDCINYLNTTSKKDALGVLKEFTDPDSEYKIKGVGPMFWTEMVRCRFGDLPLQNNKTIHFFRAIGIELGFLPEQRLRNISYCHQRWIKIWNKKNDIEIDSSMLSHMEHFAFRSEKGKSFMMEEFGYNWRDRLEKAN